MVVAAVAAGGSLISAYGSWKGGKAAKREGRRLAALARAKAAKVKAVGTIKAGEADRESQLIQSRILAVSAAGGGGALDPTVVDIMSRTAVEGKLASLTEIYNANEDAQSIIDGGQAASRAGDQASKASKWAVAGSLLSAGSSMYKGMNPKGS